MPRKLKIFGTALVVLGGLGAGCCLAVLMAVFPYLLANQYGDAVPVTIVFLLMLASAAVIIYVGIWFRRRGIRMEEDAWRASLPSDPAEDSQPSDPE